MPPAIGMVLSSGKATLPDLDQMGLEDLCDLLEVIAVDAHNRRVLSKRNKE